MSVIIQEFIKFYRSASTSKWAKGLMTLIAVLLGILTVDATGVLRWNESRRIADIALLTQSIDSRELSTHDQSFLIALRSSLLHRRSLSACLNETVLGIFRPSKRAAIHAWNPSTNAAEVHQDSSTPPMNSRIEKSDSLSSKIATLYAIRSDSAVHKRNPAQTQTVLTTAQTNSKKFISRNNLWFYLSANWWLILFYLAHFVFPMYKPSVRGTVIPTEIGLLVLFFGISYVLYWLFGLIFACPIFGHWWLTYVAVAVTSLIVFVGITQLIHRISHKK